MPHFATLRIGDGTSVISANRKRLTMNTLRGDGAGRDH
jgi:hypothetical protein